MDKLAEKEVKKVAALELGIYKWAADNGLDENGLQLLTAGIQAAMTEDNHEKEAGALVLRGANSLARTGGGLKDKLLSFLSKNKKNIGLGAGIGAAGLGAAGLMNREPNQELQDIKLRSDASGLTQALTGLKDNVMNSDLVEAIKNYAGLGV